VCLQCENLYANIDDLIVPGMRHDFTGEGQDEMQQRSTEECLRDAAVSRRDTQHKTRTCHRQRTARSHDKYKTDREAGHTTGDSGRTELRRKPPVAVRPVATNTPNTASTSPTQRRKTHPPDTLDITAIHVDQQVPLEAGARAELEQDADLPARTSSLTSTSDVETVSGDSSTSGFSSAGSDVIRATGSSDETSERNAKCQKPAVKPKRMLYLHSSCT